MSEKLTRRSLLLFFFLISILTFGFISRGNAINYGIGINKNDELIWKCKVCNKGEMNKVFGNNWDNTGLFENMKKGAKMKWGIKNTVINESTIVIEINLWLWNNEENWSIKDGEFQIIYPSNPKTYDKDLNFTNYAFLVPFLFPVPVSEYLGNLKLDGWYDVDNRVLTTLNVEISKDLILPNYPSKVINIIAIYNERGILTSYKLYIRGNVVIVDISFDKIPFFVIPALVSLTVCLSIAAIIYILNRKILTKDS